MSEKESNGTRLREIISVIHKHQIARGNAGKAAPYPGGSWPNLY